MSRTVLMIGTRKGLWLARSEDRPRAGSSTGPDDVMGEVHSVGSTPAASDAPRCSWAAGTGTSARRSCTPTTSGRPGRPPPTGGVAFPEDTGAHGRGDLVARPVGRRARRGVRRHRAVGAVPLHRPRRDLRAGARPLGPPAPHRVGTRAAEARRSTRCCRTRPTPTRMHVAMSTGGVYRTADAGHELGAGEPRDQGRVHARGGQLPRVRPVRAQGRPVAATQPRRALRAEPRRRLPLRRRRRQLGLDRRRAAGRVRLPGRHPPARQDGTLWLFPLESSYRRFPPDRACRVWRSTDCGATWEEQGKGLPDGGFFAGVMRDAMCVDDGDPAGVYIGSRDGSVYASPDEGESWMPVAEHLPDVLCLRAATI